MKRSRTSDAKTVAAAALAMAVGLFAFAGEAPKPAPKPDAKEPAKPAAEAKTAGEWQARLTAKVIEWAKETDLDYGFSIAYFRDPSHPNSVVGPFEDGRGVSGNPDAFLTLPSQSHLDTGLRIFLDQMYAHNGSLEAVIEALEQRGDVTILAEPFLTLKKGQAESTAQTGSRFPFTLHQVVGVGTAEVTLFQDTGIVLKVKLLEVLDGQQGLDDRYAMMEVNASVTSLAGYVTVAVDKDGKPGTRVPQTNTRRIHNTVLVRDKTTLIAGVIKEDSDIRNEQGPPILGDIPYVRRLFRNLSKRVKTHEILFLMHVDIIPPGAV